MIRRPPRSTLFPTRRSSDLPNVGIDVAGAGFSPESGRSMELGAKWESADQRMGATAALLDIRKRNVLTADPGNAGYSVSAGEIRSRGLEFDFAGQVTQRSEE